MAEVPGDETAQLVLCRTPVADPAAMVFHEPAAVPSRVRWSLQPGVGPLAAVLVEKAALDFTAIPFSAQGVCGCGAEVSSLHQNRAFLSKNPRRPAASLGEVLNKLSQ